MLLGALSQQSQRAARSKLLNDIIVTALYETLPRIPVAFVGTDAPAAGRGRSSRAQNHIDSELDYVSRIPFEFRSPDGSQNCTISPHVGQAGTPYFRVCQPKHPLPYNTLPEVGLIFDTLLRARNVRSENLLSLIDIHDDDPPVEIPP